MSILILSAKTGQGHASVMNTLYEGFLDKGYTDCKCISNFYESILTSNKILSDFYNFLLTSSISLCEKYVELTALTRPDKNEEIYNLTKQHYVNLISKADVKCIISTATSINYGLIRALKEEGLYGKKLFYIVITDPYDPIAPGFDIPGASRYFCANETVKDILVNKGIEANKIMITGYPVGKKFFINISNQDKKLIFDELNLDCSKKVVLLNSGSQGAMSNLSFLQEYLNSDIEENLIMLCGVNKALYRLAKLEVKRSPKKNIAILPFYTNINNLLHIADVYISKAGANSFYEALTAGIPILIDGTDGYLYQERGVTKVFDKLKVGGIIEDRNQFIKLLYKFLDDDINKAHRCRIKNLNIKNGTNKIVETIIADLESINNK